MLIFYLLISFLFDGVWTGAPQKLTTEFLTIQTKTKQFNFTVELALTNEQRSKGLMFRESMDDDYGMLFIFPGMNIVFFV
jgi:uncharacterized membrane protein (UPF0127 family)